MGFLLFSTKKRARNKEKEGEEIRNFGQNIYPRDQYEGIHSAFTRSESCALGLTLCFTAPKITSQFQIVSKYTKRGGNVAK